jgi:translation initiation factor IF-2
MASEKKKTDSSKDSSTKKKRPLDVAKKEALNLFEDEEKKAERREKGEGATAGDSQSSIFQPLSNSADADIEKSVTSVTQKKVAAKKKKPVAMDLIGESEKEAPSPTGAAAGDGGSGSGGDGRSDSPVDGGDGEDEEKEIDPEKIIHLKPPIIVKDLAEAMDVKAFKLMKDLMELEVFANQNQSIEPEIASRICEKHGFYFEKEKREKGGGVHKVEEVIEEPEAPAPEEIVEDELKLRPPIVTFMGHVDHGKTSLLDAFRGSKIADREAGGITQHVGAYSVTRGETTITFIDTPGHQAFTEMRARGANVTDIVVLVVAADDGLMPTTLEAIDHARAAGVTIIVAINKVDLARANIDKVKGQLQEKDLAPEDWGGSTICVEVSAKEGTGLDDLFEMIGLQSEILELKANPDTPARGTVIEARMEPGRGPTATIIVQSGTLKSGDAFICGNFHGKVKSLLSDQNEKLKKVGPASPAEVLGFAGLPNVGDELVVMENERSAKKLSGDRLDALRTEQLQPKEKSALETLFANIEEGPKKLLKLILKVDAQGSGEAILNALNEIESEKINLDVIRNDTGPITESDILLASASDAIIVGFGIKLENKAVSIAKREGVQVKLYSIIYELIDQVREAMLGMLDPETRESVIGHAEIKEVFKLSSGRVAGCLVTDGRIARKGRARVVRDGQAVYDGGLQTLRRFKDDVKEVRKGLECGIRLGNFNDYMKGDIIECYELEKLDVTL